jgi:hypothetical protein
LPEKKRDSAECAGSQSIKLIGKTKKCRGCVHTVIGGRFKSVLGSEAPLEKPKQKAPFALIALNKILAALIKLVQKIEKKTR